MRDKIKISILLTERAISGKWVRPLAVYHAMKFTFGNSVVYDYKKRKNELAEKFQISTRTLHTYLKILRNEGLCFESNNRRNLHLTSLKKIKSEEGEKRNYKITLTADDDLNLISIKLYGKKIEHHLNKMAFARAMKMYGQRNLYKMRTSETAAVPLSLSLRNIAKLLNVSKDKAADILKELVAQKIINIIPQNPIKVSDGYIDLSSIEDYPGYKFTTQRGTFVQFGAKIEIIKYPVQLPKITCKMFKRYYRSA